MIEIQGLTKRYGTLTAVDDLTITLEDGLIYGFLGVNGAGKSTTLGMLTGCLAPTAGSVRINGFDLLTQPIEAKRQFGYLPETPPLYLDMTAREYLRFIARARGVDRRDLDAAIDAAMEKTNITDVQNRLLRQLSKGYRQRVGLAQAILGDPKIIILDEPTVGLDPGQVVEIRELIRSLGGKHTVIFSSHILSEVSLLCDRVFIIDHGRLVSTDTPENLEKMLDEGEILEINVLASPDAARAALKAVDGIAQLDCIPTDDGCALTIRAAQDVQLREPVARALSAAGIAVTAMQVRQHSLEDAFLKLTHTNEED